MTVLSNVPFETLKVGDKATYQRTLTERDLVLFAEVSGDHNPVHLDKEYASTSMFGERIAHGMWTGSLISAALAMKLPGPGGIYRGQELKFLKPVKLGDTLTVELEVIEIKERGGRALMSTNVVNQDGVYVVKGTATILPSKGEVILKAPQLPAIKIEGLND